MVAGRRHAADALRQVLVQRERTLLLERQAGDRVEAARLDEYARGLLEVLAYCAQLDPSRPAAGPPVMLR